MANEPTIQEICSMYDIAVYQVGEQDDAPKEDLGKFFVSVLAGDFLDVDLGTLPLSDSQENAENVAVEKLQLKQLYAFECANGPTTRRLTLNS